MKSKNTTDTSNVALNAKGEPVIPTEIMKYKHKTKDKVGVLVHNGITKTLRFEDGTESILSPANFKRYWDLLSVEPKEDEVKSEEPVEVETPTEEPVVESPVEQKPKKKSKVEPVKRDRVVDPKHMSWKAFRGEMIAHNAKSDTEIFGVIVYSQDNFAVEYSEQSRSYRVSSVCNGFNGRRGIYGDCLDGSESRVTLPSSWKIEYCYMEDENYGKEH